MARPRQLSDRPPTLGVAGWLAVTAGIALFLILLFRSLTVHEEIHETHAPALWGFGVAPFTALLGAIAILPLLNSTRHWWESNLNRLKVALGLACMTAAYFLAVEGPGSVPRILQHAVIDDYLPFIMLLFALYVISGGIQLEGDLPAHPMTNTIFLAIGAASASFVGTTGASMLLIRPLLQTNSERRHVTHTVIFFIFLVSNIGGCLLPIGDPPLFLGYLRGVPFLWTLVLWKEWALLCALLLVIYYVWDSFAYRQETKAAIRRDESQRRPLRLRGSINLLWLVLVVFAVWQLTPGRTVPGTTLVVFPFLRELAMMFLVMMSLVTTPRGVREANRFNYDAILEVAALFIGIFITMQAPIAVLNAHGAALGLNEPWHFFWMTGGLSSFLDNAPTYAIFFETAKAMTHAPGADVLELANGQFIRETILIAISLGAVFMGANTYIGNGPNFMVKSIAEQSGVKMPSFFGYMFRYSLPVLVPLFVIVTLVL